MCNKIAKQYTKIVYYNKSYKKKVNTNLAVSFHFLNSFSITKLTNLNLFKSNYTKELVKVPT